MMKIYTLVVTLSLHLMGAGQGRIEGQVIDRTTGKNLINTEISLWVIDSIRYDTLREKTTDPKQFSLTFLHEKFVDTIYKRIQKKFSDSTGRYVFENLDPNYYSVRAFHVTDVRNNRKYGELEEITGIPVHCDSKISQAIQLRVFCEYDSTSNLTHCPTCHKKDQVLIIRNGLYPPDGEAEEPGYYYSGYCFVERCHPTKRCMRCKYEF